MAQVQAPYGVRGWVKVQPFSDAPDALLRYDRWWLQAPDAAGWREVARPQARVHAGALLARLEGVDTREAAQALRGTQVGVPRAAMPAPDAGELYRIDLVGLEVVNREGVALGRIAEVQDFGAHPVLRVVAGGGLPGGGQERLIPFVDAHVDRVDLPARRVEVDWPADF